MLIWLNVKLTLQTHKSSRDSVCHPNTPPLLAPSKPQPPPRSPSIKRRKGCFYHISQTILFIKCHFDYYSDQICKLCICFGIPQFLFHWCIIVFVFACVCVWVCMWLCVWVFVYMCVWVWVCHHGCLYSEVMCNAMCIHSCAKVWNWEKSWMAVVLELWQISCTVEPRYNEVLRTMKIISGFALYQGKKNKEI